MNAMRFFLSFQENIMQAMTSTEKLFIESNLDARQ